MNRTHNVVVHKANIALKTGESLRDFTRALSDAGDAHIRQKLNLPDKGTDVYAVETFAKTVVFSVYRYGDAIKPKERNKHYGVPYTRKDNGDFEFGETVEVQRVTRFEPKSATATIAKAVNKAPGKAFGPNGEWQETNKSFWNGVL